MNIASKLLKLMALVFCVGIVSACANQSSTAQLRGEVTYRVRMALPPQAVIEVKLSDVSRQDVAATVIAQDVIKADGKQVPIPFVLSYDPAKIQPGHTYSVSARITVDDKLWFISTEHLPAKLDGSDAAIIVWLDKIAEQ